MSPPALFFNAYYKTIRVLFAKSLIGFIFILCFGHALHGDHLPFRCRCSMCFVEMQAMSRAGVCTDAAIDAPEWITGPCAFLFVHRDAK